MCRVSCATQVKALVAALKREAATRGSDIFRHAEVAEVCARLRLDRCAFGPPGRDATCPLQAPQPTLSVPHRCAFGPPGRVRRVSFPGASTNSLSPLRRDADALVDVLRTECYLLLKGPRVYQLQQ